MESSVKTFENDAYRVEALEKPSCLLSLTIAVKPPQAKKAYQKAVKSVNKEISVPGFRKGHAPDSTVIGRYANYVEQEWKEILINDAYRASLELTKIYPLNKNSIRNPHLESCSKEEGAIVKIDYEFYPTVPEVDLSSIKIPSIAVATVSQQEVDDVVDNICRAHAEWEDVEGRAAQKDDFVDVSIDSLDEEPPKALVTDRRFELADKRTPLWLQKLIIGLRKDESAEGLSELDEQAEPQAKDNFKPTKVRVKLNGIKKMIMPEINDELAIKAGAASLDDLKDKVRRNLEEGAQKEHKQKKGEAFELALLESYQFELPSSLVESAIQDQAERDAQKNRPKEELKEDVEKQLRLYFLTKQIAKQGNISVSNQELNDGLLNYLYQNPYLYKAEQDEATTRAIVAKVSENLLQSKILDYALSQIRVE